MPDVVLYYFLACVLAIFIGGLIAFAQDQGDQQNNENHNTSQPQLNLIGKVESDERGLHVHLSWKWPDRPHSRQHCQVYRTPEFREEKTQDKIGQLNVYDYEYKDYTIQSGALYEYRVVETNLNRDNENSANPISIKSNVFLIVVK